MSREMRRKSKNEEEKEDEKSGLRVWEAEKRKFGGRGKAGNLEI